MPRIICDTYVKKDKKIFRDDPELDFNKRIQAVNSMYGWLYEKGILEKVSFEFKDYQDSTCFAFDAKDLLQYRSEMENSTVPYAALAVRHIFDEPYTPCQYSGSIELGWMMGSYRNVDGCVGRSWECGLAQELNTVGVSEVAEVLKKKGVHAAVEKLFSQFDWNLTLPEQKKYEAALKHFEKDANGIEHIEGIAERHLIYCYEHNKSLMDFDFWIRFEVLCGENLSYDEFLALNEMYVGDPYDLDEKDLSGISGLKQQLQFIRSAESSGLHGTQKTESLETKIQAAFGRIKEKLTKPKDQALER